MTASWFSRRFYILIDRIAVPETDEAKWSIWFGKDFLDRMVAKTRIGPIEISTVFIGIDHNFFGDGSEPHLFETMIFRGKDGCECWRCSTWQEAEAQHAKAVAAVRSEIIENAR
jgi:hypothetical protein